MDLKLFLLMLTLFWSASEAKVKCFKCTQPLMTDDPSTIDPKSCAGGQINQTEAVNCRFGCTKWSSIFPNGDIRVERGCADAWAAEPECTEMRTNGEIYSKCFCFDDYCNGAAMLYTSWLVASRLVVVVMLIIIAY